MDEFSFFLPYRVGVADINYGGHVANSAVLNFFQDARIAYLARLGSYSEMDLGGCGVIMPEAHVYYRQEMFLADQLNIYMRISELKRSSFITEYRILREQQVTAEGTIPLVCYDYKVRKSCRIPAGFAAAVGFFEGFSAT